MPRSEYYHPQADLAFEWFSQQGSTKNAFDWWIEQTNIGIWPRELTLSLITTSLNDLLRVVTDDCVLDPENDLLSDIERHERREIGLLG